MADIFPIVTSVIKTRRTTKPPEMNGKKISDQQVSSLLELADWAPTHANTEPWRFVVYSDPQIFCHQHAELYKANTPADKFMQLTYDKLYYMGDKASHVIIAIMKRGDLPKIPVIEEISATACAMQNILLGATAAGIASYWGTGGMTYSEALKQHLALREQDQVMGIIYLGYSDKAIAGKRTTPLSDKVEWK
ncbi:nitroreductase [Mucilaginibacter sp. HMF5004]|nr:nitroreductase [Mucilaginibacter rivuli]